MGSTTSQEEMSEIAWLRWRLMCAENALIDIAKERTKQMSVVTKKVPLPGAWVVVKWDTNAVPLGVFAEEVEAQRFAAENHGEAFFVPWGSFDNRRKQEREAD